MAKVIHYFIPHKENNHKPYLTRNSGLASILILALAIQTSLNVFTSSRPQILGFATSIYKSEVISLTNQQRQQGGLATLYNNAKLDQAAQLKAQHMFDNDYWAHVSPDGVQPWYWFDVVDYNYVSAGENLARDFDTSSGVVSAWMASPSHRENIMYPNFTEIGIAIVNGNLAGEDTTLVVQLFGKPTPTSDLVVQPIVTEPTPVPPTVTPKPPTPIPTKIKPANPTQTPTTIPEVPTPTSTLIPTETPTPTITPTPSPAFAYTDPGTTKFNSGSTIGSVANPPNPPNTALTVISNIKSFSLSRLFTIALLAALILLLGSESAVLWYKGIHHPHAHRLVHVGILLLALIGTLYGANGSIM